MQTAMHIDAEPCFCLLNMQKAAAHIKSGAFCVFPVYSKIFLKLFVLFSTLLVLVLLLSCFVFHPETHQENCY